MWREQAEVEGVGTEVNVWREGREGVLAKM